MTYSDLQHIDFMAAEELFNTKEVLTAAEAQLVKLFLPKQVTDCLFYHAWNDTYLNLNVYSEHDHDARQLKIEQGI